MTLYTRLHCLSFRRFLYRVFSTLRLAVKGLRFEVPTYIATEDGNRSYIHLFILARIVSTRRCLQEFNVSVLAAFLSVFSQN